MSQEYQQHKLLKDFFVDLCQGNTHPPVIPCQPIQIDDDNMVPPSMISFDRQDFNNDCLLMSSVSNTALNRLYLWSPSVHDKTGGCVRG